MGDQLEVATKSSIGAGIFESNLTIDGQLDRCIELFTPYSDLIDGIIEGNHEARIYKGTGIDITKRLSMALNAPYLKHSGMIKYNVGVQRYMINAWHGSKSGNTSAGSAMNNCIEMADKCVADVYAMGHTHRLMTSSRKFIVPKTVNLEEITQHFVLTGSSVDYDESYAEELNYTRQSMGYAVLKLFPITKRVDVTLQAV